MGRSGRRRLTFFRIPRLGRGSSRVVACQDARASCSLFQALQASSSRRRWRRRRRQRFASSSSSALGDRGLGSRAKGNVKKFDRARRSLFRALFHRGRVAGFFRVVAGQSVVGAKQNQGEEDAPRRFSRAALQEWKGRRRGRGRLFFLLVFAISPPLARRDSQGRGQGTARVGRRDREGATGCVKL